MGSYIHFLTISLGWSLLFCNAAVTVSLINSVNGVDSLECSSYGVVSCRINPYADLMNWEINSTSYAMCSPACSENPNFPRTYSSAYDVKNGVFNLTVENVNFNDNSTTFKCDDGSSFDSITVEVVPTYSENKTMIYETGGEKQVEFTTTCVKPGVKFNWFTIKTDNSDRKLYSREQSEMTNDTECSNNSCGGVGTLKVSSIITIPSVSNFLEEKSKEERYLEVVVIYKNPDEERTFRFEETFPFEVCSVNCGFIIGFIYILRWIQLLTSYSAGSSLCALYQNKTSDISKTTLFISFLTCLPLIGSCVAIVLNCLELKKDKKKCERKCCKVTLSVISLCYLPLVGTIFTGWLLFCKSKECCSYGKCKTVLFAAFFIFDICTLLVMILTCTDIFIEVRCHLYAVYSVYAFIGLVFSWMNFVCLAECLQTESNRIGNESIVLCDSCKQLQIESAAEMRCLDCNEFLCEDCKEDHLMRHSKIMENNIFYLQASKEMKPDRFACYYCKGFVESYCLQCQQFLCEKCIKDHAEHKSLRHCQQEAGKRRCQIDCKPCQNKGNKSGATYYSSGDKCFVCGDCVQERGLTDITATNDPNRQCKRCEHHKDGIINPVECHCMVYDEYMCAVCFEEIRKQSLLLHFPIEARRNEHTELCVLHSVSGLPVTQHVQQKNIRKIAPDVYCLVCGEFLCTRCFFLHLNLKQLWQQQRFDKDFLKHAAGQVKPKTHIERLEKQKTEEKRKNVPIKSIFAGCFPVFGIFLIIYTLHKINKKEVLEDKYRVPPSCCYMRVQ